MFENQYGVKVKGVRADNAPELRFTELYQKKGIEAFHSCLEIPEQNSVVERKHQHILNFARSSLFQSQVPLSFWGDCVLTAVFLINMTPSELLHNKTPFEILTSKVPNYHQIRSFGCLCYASTSPKQRTKFEAHSKACVFMGYPSYYKGYKLLNLETNKIFISRNVVFHEEIFPFASENISEVTSDFFNTLEHLPSNVSHPSPILSP